MRKRHRVTHRVADEHEPVIRRAVRRALQAMRDAVDVDAVASSLENVHRDGLPWVVFSNAMIEIVKPAIRDTMADAGDAAAASLLRWLVLRGMRKAGPRIPPRVIGDTGARLGFSFDMTNPEAVRWIELHAAELVYGVNQETKRAIANLVQRSFQEGIPPRKLARMLRGVLGLSDAQRAKLLQAHQAEPGISAQALAERLNLTEGQTRNIARVLQSVPRQMSARNIAEKIRQHIGLNDRQSIALDNYNKSLAQSVLEGIVDPDRAAELHERYQQRLLAWRADTIARNESMTASNLGQRALWDQAVESGLMDPQYVRRRPLITGDSRVCSTCAVVPFMNPYGVKLDEPFKTPIGPKMDPPFHGPNCRCTVALIFADEDGNFEKNDALPRGWKWVDGKLVGPPRKPRKRKPNIRPSRRKT